MIYGYELIKYFSESQEDEGKVKKFLKDKEVPIISTSIGLAGIGSGYGIYKKSNNKGQKQLQDAINNKDKKLKEAFEKEVSKNEKIREFNGDLYEKLEDNIAKKHDKLVDYANKHLTPGSEKYNKMMERAKKYEENSDFRDLVFEKVYHKNKKFVSYKDSKKIAAFDRNRDKMMDDISNKISKKSRKAGILTGLGVAGTLGAAYGGKKLYDHYKKEN